MKIQDRIEYLSNSDYIKDAHWYVIKQNLENISNLCQAIYILREIKKENELNELTIKFEDRFKEIQKNDDVFKFDYRIISNGEYLGLVQQGKSSKNLNKIINQTFIEILDRVNDDIHKLKEEDLYYDITERQIEKLYLKFKGDKSNNARNVYLIHPTFALYKILVLMGKYTGDYSISIDEFKVFLCYAENYEELIKIADYIIKSRVNYKQEVYKISKKINNIRIGKIFKLLKSIKFSKNRIELIEDYVEDIEGKIRKYEKSVKDKITRDNMHEALNMNIDIFKYYEGME